MVIDARRALDKRACVRSASVVQEGARVAHVRIEDVGPSWPAQHDPHKTKRSTCLQC